MKNVTDMSTPVFRGSTRLGGADQTRTVEPTAGEPARSRRKGGRGARFLALSPAAVLTLLAGGPGGTEGMGEALQAAEKHFQG
jgi:hypothetical protein